MPRFVLLYHDCPPDYERPSHWDLMLEDGDVLKTWAIENLPIDWRAPRDRTSMQFPLCPLSASVNEVTAEQLADHRPAYLTFEGPLSRERGNVVRVASGTYETKLVTPDHLIATLDTESALGTIELLRESAHSGKWRLSVRPQLPK